MNKKQAEAETVYNDYTEMLRSKRSAVHLADDRLTEIKMLLGDAASVAVQDAIWNMRLELDKVERFLTDRINSREQTKL
jgi:putative component of toxin-antitoxin plasmid stabilization module